MSQQINEVKIQLIGFGVSNNTSGEGPTVDTSEVEAIVNREIQKVVGGAPETLDTLKEIADAMITQQDVLTAVNIGIINKAEKSEIPTKVSLLENDSEYLTTHQPIKTINNQSLIGVGNINIEAGSADLSNYYTKSDIDNADYATKSYVNTAVAEAATGSVTLDDYATKEYVDNKVDSLTNFSSSTLGGGLIYDPSLGAPIVLNDAEKNVHVVVECIDYNTDAYPLDRYTPIGIVVIPKSHTTAIYKEEDEAYGKHVMLSLKSMSKTNINGTTNDASGEAEIFWGGIGVNVTGIINHNKWYRITNTLAIETPTISGEYGSLATDYFTGDECLACPGIFYAYGKFCPCPYLLQDGILKPNPAYYEVIDENQHVISTDFNGRSNTNAILSKISVANWLTIATIPSLYSAGNYPAAAACWRYSTPGTNLGDWWLPSAGELGYMFPFLSKINVALNKINSIKANSAGILATKDICYWSSTLESSNIAIFINSAGGLHYTAGKDYGFCVRCFAVVNEDEVVENPIVDYIQTEVDKVKEIIEETLSNSKLNTDKLYGKKWCTIGDSFTEYTNKLYTSGKYAGACCTYPYLISERTGIEIFNLATSGDKLTVNVMEKYLSIPEDIDYITIKIGINDSILNVPLGDIGSTNTSEFYGAWNTLLTWIINNRPYAHVGIIISNATRDDAYPNAERAIAKKYGIPYLDLELDESIPYFLSQRQRTNVDPTIKTIRNNTYAISSDDRHPNWRAHILESNFVELFLRRI